MFLYIFKIIIKSIMTSSQFDPNSTSVRPQNLWTSPFYGSMNGSGLKILVLPTELNFRAKAHLASQQSHNSRAWGWKYGYKWTFPLFLTTSLNFLIRVTMGQSFKPIESRFSHRAETWEQKPTELGNILTIPNLKGGNMGIGEPSLSSSQPPSISSSRWLWVKVSDLLCFYTFSALLL